MCAGCGLEQPDGQHAPPPGALTKAIVATKQRLEGDMPAAEASGFPAISAAQRRKERDLVAREVRRSLPPPPPPPSPSGHLTPLPRCQIGRLQSSIQTLCRTANPLGRIMDYVQVGVHWQLPVRLHPLPRPPGGHGQHAKGAGDVEAGKHSSCRGSRTRAEVSLWGCDGVGVLRGCDGMGDPVGV